MKKKNKNKTKKDDKKWFFYFGFGASFIAAGFLWMFYHYARMPYLAAEGIESKFPRLSIFLVVFGTLTFLISKYFYEKQR